MSNWPPENYPPKEIAGEDASGARIVHRLYLIEAQIALYAIGDHPVHSPPPKIGPAHLFGAVIVRGEGDSPTVFKPWMLVEKSVGKKVEPQVVCGVRKAGNGGHAYLIVFNASQRKFSYLRCNLASVVGTRSLYNNEMIEELYRAFLEKENAAWTAKKERDARNNAATRGGETPGKAPKMDGDDGSKGRKWSEEEDSIMIAAVNEFKNTGRKIEWSEVARKLGDRTTTQVTCHWHNTLKPRLHPGKFAPRGKIVGVKPPDDDDDDDEPAKKRAKMEDGALRPVAHLFKKGGTGDVSNAKGFTSKGALSPDSGTSAGGAKREQTDEKGSSTKKKRKKVVDHDRPFICPYPGCGSGFTRRFDMGRHCERIHGMKLAEIRAKVLNGEFGPAAMANAKKDPYFSSGTSAVNANTQPNQSGPQTSWEQTLRVSLEHGSQRNLRTLAESLEDSAQLVPARLDTGLKQIENLYHEAGVPLPLTTFDELNRLPEVNDKKLSDLAARFREISELAVEALGMESALKTEEERQSRQSSTVKVETAAETKDGPSSLTETFATQRTLEQKAIDLRLNLRRVEQDIDDARASWDLDKGLHSAQHGAPEWMALAKQTRAPQAMVTAWRTSEAVKRTQPSLALFDFV